MAGEARGPAVPRMDLVERAKYIKECKQKLGLDDNVLLKSSRRAVLDGFLTKDMPSLEFNGVYKWHKKAIFQPHEMTWSLKDFNNEETLDRMDAEQATRIKNDLVGEYDKVYKYSNKMRQLDPDSKGPPMASY